MNEIPDIEVTRAMHEVVHSTPALPAYGRPRQEIASSWPHRSTQNNGDLPYLVLKKKKKLARIKQVQK